MNAIASILDKMLRYWLGLEVDGKFGVEWTLDLFRMQLYVFDKFYYYSLGRC